MGSRRGPGRRASSAVRRGRAPRVRRSCSVVLAVAAVLALGACGANEAPRGETVVLLHGLGRTPHSMAVLGERLQDAGYYVVDFGYPSRSESIEELVERLDRRVDRCCSIETGRVHFVTHSLGGVLVRAYLEDLDRPFHGRVVMLAPPSSGSEIVDMFGDSPLRERLLGPAGAALGTDSTAVVNSFGPVDYELGVIAGDRSYLPMTSWLIPGPDDGIVSTEGARIEGAPFLVVPGTHTFLMNRRDVADATIAFLRTGTFEAPESGPELDSP